MANPRACIHGGGIVQCSLPDEQELMKRCQSSSDGGAGAALVLADVVRQSSYNSSCTLQRKIAMASQTKAQVSEKVTLCFLFVVQQQPLTNDRNFIPVKSVQQR